MHSLLQIADDVRLLNIAIVFYTKNKLNDSVLIGSAYRYDLKERVKDFMQIINGKDKKIKTKTLPVTSKKGINDMIRLYGGE